MNTACAPQRSSTPAASCSRRVLVGLLTLVASICGVSAAVSTFAGAGPIDEAHVGVVVGEHRGRRSHRLRRRDTDPVRRPARRCNRCLTHAVLPRPVQATAHRTETPLGPPVHRGPPVA